MSIDSNYDEIDNGALLSNLIERLYEKKCSFFIRRFEYFLRSYYGFVIESENRTYRNYIHFSGIAVIRIYHNVSIQSIINKAYS